MGFLEAGKENGAVDAVENGGGPVEDFGEVELVELGGVGDFVEEFLEDGDAEMVGGEAPVEEGGRREVPPLRVSERR